MYMQGVCKRRQARTIRRILEWFRIIGDFGKLLSVLDACTVVIISDFRDLCRIEIMVATVHKNCRKCLCRTVTFLGRYFDWH